MTKKHPVGRTRLSSKIVASQRLKTTSKNLLQEFTMHMADNVATDFDGHAQCTSHVCYM